MNIAEIIYKYILPALKSFLPGILSSGKDFLQNKIKPAGILENIKALYLKKGFKYNERANIIVFRNKLKPGKYQVFNDILCLDISGSLSFYWITSEPGEWTTAEKNKYNIQWVGCYPEGFYPENFLLKIKNKKPRFYQQGKALLIDVDKNKLRLGGCCDIHATSKDKTETSAVSVSSAGCQVFRKESNLINMAERVKAEIPDWKTCKIDFAIFNIDEISLAGVKIL